MWAKQASQTADGTLVKCVCGSGRSGKEERESGGVFLLAERYLPLRVFLAVFHRPRWPWGNPPADIFLASFAATLVFSFCSDLPATNFYYFPFASGAP